MTSAQQIARSGLTGGKVLAIAILLSLCWHLFWILMIKVVSAPALPSHAKYSKVSFLGPLLTKVTLEVSDRMPERSSLEKIFFEHSGSDTSWVKLVASDTRSRYVNLGRQNSALDKEMVRMTAASLGDQKAEPDYPAE